MTDPCKYWPINGPCPHCNKPAFVITCGVCGHKGCYRQCERHDCYWVFRERFNSARASDAVDPHVSSTGKPSTRVKGI